MEVTQHPLVPSLEHYKTVRSQIEHEDNLVSQRLSWLLASQSFLFTAYAITLNGPVQLHSKTFEAQEGLLIFLLPLVAMCSAAMIWIGVVAGIFIMHKLRSDFERQVGQEIPKEVPSIQTTGIALVAGSIGPVLIPPLFIVVWLILVLRG